MTLSHFRVLYNDLTKKDPDVFPDQAPLIIFDNKSDLCMAKDGKDTKHNRHIAIITQLIRNGEYLNLHNTVWYGGGLKLTYIGTNNVREDQLNTRLGYNMVIIYNRQKTCTIGIIG